MSCTWLTPKQAAKKVGVDRTTVYRWLNTGGLRYYITPRGTSRIWEKDLFKESSS